MVHQHQPLDSLVLPALPPLLVLQQVVVCLVLQLLHQLEECLAHLHQPEVCLVLQHRVASVLLPRVTTVLSLRRRLYIRFHQQDPSFRKLRMKCWLIKFRH